MGKRSGQFVNAIDNFDESVDRLRAALDASCVVGTWDWDILRGVMIYDAGAAQLLTGDVSVADQEITGLETISAVHPADHEWLIEHTKEAVRKGGLMLAEYRVITEDGTVRWLLSRGRTYQDHAGRPFRSRGIIIDITEMHGAGERYVVSNMMTPDDPLERAADMVITLKEMLGDGVPVEARGAVDLLLFSLGRALARRSAGH